MSAPTHDPRPTIPDPRSPIPTVRRAIQCALEMQAHMAAMAEWPTRAGPFRLSMKIGLGLGEVLTTTVGDKAIRLEYLLAGSAIDHCAEAEQHAAQGDVVLSNDLLAFATVRNAQSLTQGFSRITRLARRPLPQPWPPLPDPPAPTIKTIACYLPPTIAERIIHGQTSFVDEHRTVTTLFVRFKGFDYHDPASVARLQAYLSMVVQISDRYGGYLRQVDVGDKGSLFIVLFGAPNAHEDDADRALLCALDLRTAAGARAIPTATGITTGRVFCGLIGSEQRREYAAIGDSVNLAARLMSAAQMGQILVDAPTRQGIGTPLSWNEMLPLTVKGKREPIAVASLQQRQHRSATRLRAPGYLLPMVGRQAEFARGQELLAALPRGRGHLLGITAEAGMGKSRLIAELLRYTSALPITYYTSECLSYGTHSSYQVWQPLLRAVFGLGEGTAAEHEQQIQMFLTRIDEALLERAALLNTMLGTTFPENDLTRGLEPKLRKQLLEELLITCLRQTARVHPLLLILEDCHWIDELSRELLLAVAQRSADVPLLMLVTFRPADANTPPLVPFATLPHAEVLHLGAFSEHETAQLIALKLAHLFNDHQQVPAPLLARISERAQGNPFYVDELLNLLHDRGIDLHDATALAQLELPPTLQRLILSRIDRLAEGPKSTLKVASVIGRLFQARWLQPIYPPLGAGKQVEAHLRELHEADLTQLERSEPELEYVFKHLLTRDVAYESLALQTRTALHEKVGVFIEQTYAQELIRWLDLLAYHYGQSTNLPKQREYFRRAGDAARAAFAPEAAQAYYERLVPLVDGAEKAEACLELSEIQTDSGRWEAAEQNARAGLAVAEELGDQRLLARGFHHLGFRFAFNGLHAQALPYFERALEHMELLGDHHELARLLTAIGSTYHYQGDHSTGLRYYKQALQVATAGDDQEQIGWAMMCIGHVHYYQSHWQAARTWYERGLAVATAINHLIVIEGLHISLANIARFTAAYQDALAYYQQALALAQRLGHLPRAMLILGNMSRTYSSVGQHTEALACAQTSLLLGSTTVGFDSLGWNLPHIGMCYGKLGWIADARRLFDCGLAVCRALNLSTPLARYLYERALFHLRQHDLPSALDDTRELRALADQLQYKEQQLNARLLEPRLEVAFGQRLREAALTEVKGLRLDWPASHEQAAIAYTLWCIDPSQVHERDEAAARYASLFAGNPNSEYRERYEELTNDRLPDPPPLPAPPSIVSFEPLTVETLLALANPILTRPYINSQEC